MKTYRSLQTSTSIEALELRIAPAGIVVAAGGGVVSLFTDADENDTHETLADSFAPFGKYKGAISVALGDFDGDGNDELVVAKAAGVKALVKVYDLTGGGVVGARLDKFVPFPDTKNQGVSIAAGDLNADDTDELLVGAGPGGAANVLVYHDNDADGSLSDIWPDMLRVFAAPFKGGVKVALGDTTNAGGDELIAGMWTGGGAVAIFNAGGDLSISNDNGGAPIEVLTPFGAAYTGGVNVASGLIDGAGGLGAEVIVGTGSGKAKVRIFTDADANGFVGNEARFDQIKPDGTGLFGAAVFAGDTDNSGTFVEVLTGVGAHVTVFDDTNDAAFLLSDNDPGFEFDAFASLTGGLNLAFGKVRGATYTFAENPRPIPEAGLGDLNASIFIPAGSGIIRDLDLSLAIGHTFIGDLDVSLTHVPTGTTIPLFTDIGGSDDGLIVRLSDEAGTDVGTVDNPNNGSVSGIFNLEGGALLSNFDGMDMAGEWRLTITDDTAAGADIGTLFTWSLHMQV